MAETVLIGDLELTRVTEIRVMQSRKLTIHPVSGWDSDFVQDHGEVAAQIILSGLAVGEDAGTHLEQLRVSFASGEPQDFVSSAAVATDIEQILLEDMKVVQSARMPDGYAYAMTLRRYTAPPPATIGGFSASFLADLSDFDSALGLENMADFADALGTAQGALNSLDKIKDFVEEAAEFIDGAQDIKALLDAAGKVVNASNQ